MLDSWACRAAIDVWVIANRTSGCKAISSRAYFCERLVSPPVIRYSMWRFWPRIHPFSLRDVSRTSPANGSPMRAPIRRTRPCALARPTLASIARPSINSRLFMRPPSSDAVIISRRRLQPSLPLRLLFVGRLLHWGLRFRKIIRGRDPSRLVRRCDRLAGLRQIQLLVRLSRYMLRVRLDGSIRRFERDLLDSIVDLVGSFLKGWFFLFVHVLPSFPSKRYMRSTLRL